MNPSGIQGLFFILSRLILLLDLMHILVAFLKICRIAPYGPTHGVERDFGGHLAPRFSGMLLGDRI